MFVKIEYVEGGENRVPYSLFETYNITTIPADGTKLSVSENNNKSVRVAMGVATPKDTTPLTVKPRALTADDFIVNNASFTYDGTAKSVSVAANPDTTSGTVGDITVKYDPVSPINVGTYTVSFDVAGSTNYSKTDNLSKGTLEITKATPVASDFDFTGNTTVDYDGSTKTVTVTAKGTVNGMGTVTNIKYNGNTTAPTAGTYAVTFDVLDGTNYSGATNFSAGTLTINNIVLNNLTDLQTLLSHAGNTNDVNTPFVIKLNVSSLGGTSGASDESGSLGYILNNTKFVSLDLSGSTFNIVNISAFKDCTSLTSVTIPNTVTSIGIQAFRGCTNLPDITIPNTVTSIGNSAFSGCTNLTSVIIPDSVTSIGGGVFGQCASLASVTLPNNVTSIGQSAFSGCTNLPDITIPNSVTTIEQMAFYGCTSLASVNIPNSVTSIGGFAFDSCTSLTSIIIPESVSTIGDGAFNSCTNLNTVTFQGTPTLGTAVFPGDLQTKYNTGRAGTYTRTNGSTWTKQN